MGFVPLRSDFQSILDEYCLLLLTLGSITKDRILIGRPPQKERSGGPLDFLETKMKAGVRTVGL
jgi:hypothetical protein